MIHPEHSLVSQWVQNLNRNIRIAFENRYQICGHLLVIINFTTNQSIHCCCCIRNVMPLNPIDLGYFGTGCATCRLTAWFVILKF